MDDPGRVYLKHNFQNAKKIWPPLDHKPGAGEFDQVWEDVDGKIYVIEAKGGNSTLGSRTVKNNIESARKNTRVEQGSKPYFEDITEEMIGKEEDAKAVGEKIKNSYEGKSVEYLEIRQSFDEQGNLKPVQKNTFDIYGKH